MESDKVRKERVWYLIKISSCFTPSEVKLRQRTDTGIKSLKHLLGVNCCAKHLNIFLAIGESGKVTKMIEQATILLRAYPNSSDLTCNHFL